MSRTWGNLWLGVNLSWGSPGSPALLVFVVALMASLWGLLCSLLIAFLRWFTVLGSPSFWALH